VFEDKGSLSAKNMHEVVAQAKKNLGFIDPAEQIDVSRNKKWDDLWRWKEKSKIGLNRIRKTTIEYPDGKSIISLIQDLLHSTSVQKEVWLVLGNAFSEEELKRIVLTDGEIPYHWTQLLYLIHSCHASVSAMDARFRIITGMS
jgi:hypothetical protein